MNEEEARKQAILSKWETFIKSNSRDSLVEFAAVFSATYSRFCDPDFENLSEEGLYDESPHLTQHPEHILDRLCQFCKTCSAYVVLNPTVEKLEVISGVLKCLVIICRNYDNVLLVAATDFVNLMVTCVQAIIAQLCKTHGEDKTDTVLASSADFVSFVKLGLHFLECLYDPYFVWRKRLKGWTVDVEQLLSKPAIVHNEVIPFFHECFQKPGLSWELQLSLVHMFGALMSGFLVNAALTVTPATLDVLLNVLSGKAACSSSSTSREHRAVIQPVILQAVVGMVITIHSCSPDQRQVEIPDVMSSYMQVISEVVNGDQDYQMLTSMIQAIPRMTACSDRLAMQTLLVSDEVLEGLAAVIKKSSMQGHQLQCLAQLVVQAMQALLNGSKHSKNWFEKCVGHKEFINSLQKCGQPSKDLLISLLELVVESVYESASVNVVKNAPIAVLLMKWVGFIESHDLQIWLSEEMRRMCTCSYGNRMACCREGIVTVLLSLLSQHSSLQRRTIGQIISLLERLGSLSITSAELKQLIALMKPDSNGKQFPYTTRLMRAISTMARRDGMFGPLQFFDIQALSDAISLPGIRKWPGPALSFFSLVCLDMNISLNVDEKVGSSMPYRRLLYSFVSSNGCGVEAFVTPEYHLTVASFNKKEFNTISVADTALDDGHWHSVCVVHTAGRRFSNSPGSVSVFIDGKLRSSLALKFPNLAEPITSCKVGSPGLRAQASLMCDNSGDSQPEQRKLSPLKSFFGFASRGTESSTISGSGAAAAGSSQESGTQEETMGPAICLHGQVELICVFHDALQPEQVKALSQAGTDPLFHFSKDPLLADLPGKLIARYSAKAGKELECTDLSPFQNHGSFSGSRCVNWDIKDVINCLGGIQVLFPILENLDQHVMMEMVGSDSPDSPTKVEAEELDLDDPSSASDKSTYSSELKLEYNQLTAFITTLRLLLKDKPVNKDIFVWNHCAATFGLLMQKVRKDLVDVSVLTAIQYLLEECDDNSATRSTLLQHIYHYILFDFSLWSKTHFAVRIGHIQYLSTIIKDDRKYFRKKYGVQFFLDVIRVYYSTSDVSCLSEEDSKTIRSAFFNLIKYYIINGITADELNHIVAFILAVKEASVLTEALDLLISLLESNSRKQDQLIALLYEPDQAELFYKLLTYPHQPIIFYEKVVKVLYLLLKSERVYEKNKSRLRLATVEHWGLVNLMTSYSISAPMIKRFLEQVSFTETPQTYSAILAILGLAHSSGLDIKSVATKQLLSIIVSKPGAAKGFAKLLGWQENITRLFVMERKRTFTFTSDNTAANIIQDRHTVAGNGQVTAQMSSDHQNSTPSLASSSHVLSSLSNVVFKDSSISNIPPTSTTAAAVEDAAKRFSKEVHEQSNGTSSPAVISLLPSSSSSVITNIPASVEEPQPLSFSGSACGEELNGTHHRPCDLHLHSVYGAEAESQSMAENEEVEFFLVAEPTPVTPMYMKRTFYELGTSEDEENGLLQGSRSSTASVEDLLQDMSLSESYSGPISASASSVSLNSSTFEGDSALGNSQTSIRGLGSSPMTEDTRDFQRFVQMRRASDNVFEAGDESRRMSSVLRGDNFRQVLEHAGIELTAAVEQKEELCQNILIVLATIMCRGIEGSTTDIWKERYQVLTWIDELGESHSLIRPPEEIKRRLMEMLLHNYLTDTRVPTLAGQAGASQNDNAIELVRLVHGFLTEADLTVGRFSNRLLEEVMSMLDALGVWDTEAATYRPEMVHKGISMLFAFSKQPDMSLVSSATAKLNSLVQTKLISSSAEASYILGALNSMITKAIDENTDNYVHLMPVLRALIDKGQELLTVNTQLPHLPKTSMNSTFFDDFKTYVYSEEWQRFISDYIGPQMTHFIESNFEEEAMTLSMFWTDCHEEMMMNHHKHNREIAGSRVKFKAHIEDVCRRKVDHENRRFQNMLTQQKNQNLFVLRQWRATKRFFTGDRGAWKDKEQTVYWKLSNHENFARMKVKLTQNYNFENYANASRLRDNIGVTDTDNSLRLEELKGVKEALVSQENIADDTLGDEEWSAISASSANQEEYTGKEKLVISADCELITVVSEVKGRLEVTTTHVYFFDCSSHKEEGEDFKWPLTCLREIHFRRYNLRRSALEVFLIDQTNYFINFPEKGMRNKIYSRILSLRPAHLTYKGQRSPGDLLRASGLTQKWINREISNFEYLMQLNTIAGRSYNDLSQYHVFPWILTDYTSKHLELDNPDVFRDLSKPMGVVNPRNEKGVREKYETFEDPSGVIENFHYGTHYSNAATVMHYLVRVEPFTTLHVQLQSGKFDVADRQLHSIPGSFASLMDNPNDVKELIPEFFYFPEFLVNFNKFDLGKLQITNEAVDDVKLPPWASTPEEFIYKHRQALESEHVSMNLHKWIDLIFGYKQKGPEAVEALNVFYYVTYEGAVDLDAIQDPKERASVEGMIRNFGQTPSQLLKEPHPRRMTIEEAVARNVKVSRPMNLFQFVQDLQTFFVEVSNDRDPPVFVCVPKNQSRSILQQGMPDNMVTVTADGVIGVHGWLPYDKAISNFYTFDKDPSVTNLKTRKRLGGPFCPKLKITAKLFVVSHDAKLLFSGGYWDNSLQVHSLTRPKLINHIARHIDIVTCLAIDNCGHHLVSGSRDTTCLIWEITQQAGVSVSLNTKPLQVLYGHDSEITAVHISTELDLVVSASKDGTVILHTVVKGQYTMTLRAPLKQGWTLDIPNMAVSDTGQIVLYCVEMEKQAGEGSKRQQKRHCLHLYSVNGKHLFSEPLEHGISDMCMSGDHLVLGNSLGQLIIKETFGLHPLTSLELRVSIQCLAMSNFNSHILVGLEDGKLIIVGRKGK